MYDNSGLGTIILRPWYDRPLLLGYQLTVHKITRVWSFSFLNMNMASKLYFFLENTSCYWAIMAQTWHSTMQLKKLQNLKSAESTSHTLGMLLEEDDASEDNLVQKCWQDHILTPRDDVLTLSENGLIISTIDEISLGQIFMTSMGLRGLGNNWW